MIQISNQQLKATINFKGAELSSLIQLSTDTEYIWQGDPIHWSRHAPVLFPIVGRLKNDEYIYQDLTYSLSQHGFARDMEFTLIRQEISYASFSLKSSSQTLMVYPFKFELIITYELIDNRLEVNYLVINKDPNTMYFSIGGHPAFNCPVDFRSKRSDYQLVFSSVETAQTQLIENGLRTGDRQLILQDEQSLPITDDLFDQDALIFENLTSSAVSLQKGNKKVLTFHFDQFPFLGIWSKSQTAPFVCLEPWFGVADTKDTNHLLANKEGIQTLQSTDEFSCQYSIELH